ncbi:MAG: nucleotidyltransferase substrate binding protein [Bacteroidota bacterium]|nr:nucleotidyltransferase substrate binding protein [Bacteroidota bacterium]
MKDELKIAVANFQNAFNSLENGIKEANGELQKDGVIQRFEFTFELLWKTLKIFLNDEGIECNSPKDCLKKAFKYGLINDEQIFLDMLIDRNNSTHVYSKEESEEIFERIKNNYCLQFKKILKELKNKI